VVVVVAAGLVVVVVVATGLVVVVVVATGLVVVVVVAAGLVVVVVVVVAAGVPTAKPITLHPVATNRTTRGTPSRRICRETEPVGNIRGIGFVAPVPRVSATSAGLLRT
jgi:hypothetical protein